MPKGVVKTEKDERLWEKAKQQVRKQYPNLSEDSEEFWKRVNGIYQQMARKTK